MKKLVDSFVPVCFREQLLSMPLITDSNNTALFYLYFDLTGTFGDEFVEPASL